ncbi:MAG: bacillithiol biosynthesis deacetylase BshB1 [Planctomycetes bacterium]|nr:bacillithiol biosynthesis deacetylase BshB1 [Planctomycetota bacterium]
MPCDLLVLMPHPDDAEIALGATIARHVRLGASVVVVDATRGEMGSRGSADERQREAEAAARVLGLAARENLGLRDGHLQAEDLAARTLVVDCLRRHRPRVVLTFCDRARHPDHVAFSRLVRPAIKAAALHALPTPSGAPAHSGMRLWLGEAELRIDPDFLVPATDEDWQRKIAALRCYSSQLHKPGSSGPETTIAGPAFIDWIEARGRAWGREAGAPYAEAFLAGDDLPRVGDLREV